MMSDTCNIVYFKIMTFCTSEMEYSGYKLILAYTWSLSLLCSGVDKGKARGRGGHLPSGHFYKLASNHTHPKSLFAGYNAILTTFNSFANCVCTFQAMNETKQVIMSSTNKNNWQGYSCDDAFLNSKSEITCSKWPITRVVTHAKVTSNKSTDLITLQVY